MSSISNKVQWFPFGNKSWKEQIENFLFYFAYDKPDGQKENRTVCKTKKTTIMDCLRLTHGLEEPSEAWDGSNIEFGLQFAWTETKLAVSRYWKVEGSEERALPGLSLSFEYDTDGRVVATIDGLETIRGNLSISEPAE